MTASPLFSFKPIVILSLVAGMWGWTSPASAQEAAVRIGTVNTAKVFTEMQETKDLKQKMDTDRKILEGTELDKKGRIKSIQDERDRFKPGSEQWEQKNAELLRTAIEFETWGRLTQANVQREQKIQMKNLFAKIQQATAEVAQAKGIDLVIAEQAAEFPENIDQINVDQLRGLINSRNVLYSNPAKVDLSAEVVIQLDKNYKQGK